MKTIGGFQFPDLTDYDCKPEAWHPTIRWRALRWDVLTAATTRIHGCWKAYIAPVAGKNHDLEHLDVLQTGGKLTENVARVLYPEFSDLPYDQ